MADDNDESLDKRIAARRADPNFTERLRNAMERNGRALKRLAEERGKKI